MFNDILGNDIDKSVQTQKKGNNKRIIKILIDVKDDLEFFKKIIVNENDFMEGCKKLCDGKDKVIEEVIDPNVKEIEEIIEILTKEEI